MKKLSLLTAAMLCCSLAFAQEAEEEGTVLKFIPRFDVNPYVGLSDNSNAPGFSLGNSSLYTLFEGNFGESDFSYSAEGHWLSANPSELYSQPNFTNWLDWAYVNYNKNLFNFSIGKQILAAGTFEEDAYDFDSHFDLNTTFWNNLPSYVWAAQASFGTEDNYFAFQLSNSPFAEEGPLKDKLLAYNFKVAAGNDISSTLTSFNLMNTPSGESIKMLAIGEMFSFGDFDFVVDAAFRGFDKITEEKSLAMSLVWNASDSFDFTLKGGFEKLRSGCGDVLGWNPADNGEDPYDYFVPASLEQFYALKSAKSYNFVGALVNWYPLDDLRVHAVASYNNWSNSLSLNAGITYYFDLAKFIRK